ncbi:SGNH/GDSL hydrolase family protein [Streptomyces deccanensis]|uniref:SGNH/GDSL hydrolase family protein n=1 Tax=Streptomyces deccanensis TaxID=424188 RepID=UPI001EFB9F63|nr:SGNH/GDSL hydrolase family protein [Streptomyces deccanensis]ULR55024.1 SGNH/GDSL hydrolase family protein [Streptomyces deccanensis]
MAVVLSTPGPASADDTARSSDSTYYISLGDSLASGYQPDVDKDTGIAYTDQLYAQLKQHDPGLKHIRLGCTGETTTSLLKGGTCDYPHAKSQLDAALKTLAQHHGRVVHVTLSVGANDIQACVGAAGTLDGACLDKVSQTMGQNLARIAGALRKAGTKNTQFVGSTYYNPFLATWLLSDAGQQAAKESAPLIDAGNSGIAQVYKSVGFKVANVAGAYHSDDFGNPVNLPGAGEVPANVAEICRLTWACTRQDPHPNAAGHKAIAAAFAAQLSKIPQDPARPTPSPTPGGAENAGANKPTTNGNLAETGAPGSAPVLAGAGLGVVLVGTAAVYLARRRRTSAQS